MDATNVFILSVKSSFLSYSYFQHSYMTFFIAGPLTAIYVSSSPRDGSKGLPGAYSEDAALKAYPKCETVPCDKFQECQRFGI
ncbi:arogenate dehydratase/prephenate dehydratase 1, chloroplastic-like [Arachis ipaensis]|uniref:arogenate dehydratase/prephenate dehydratase 1, chloroplastic-like n=1 Tax=Arachis ipaensis TaxID=130454 RepID=UPI000A2B41F8|nr:arogenate dehydratase/prephenate dehydratase 1, chloroplastic-like [Arachis ipaensis]